MDKRRGARARAPSRDGERVAVHGDFDVDGITGCALLYELLTHLTVDGSRAQALPAFIPDRATDGYGVAARMVREWAAEGVTLLLTVDTGSAAHAEIALAQDLGIDVIVLDHHIYEERPARVALVNPRRPDAHLPQRRPVRRGRGLQAGAGAAPTYPASLPDGFLEHGARLRGARAGRRPDAARRREPHPRAQGARPARATATACAPGVTALLRVAGLDRGFPVTAADLAYQLAPRLNACGRIGRVMAALELLLTRRRRRRRPPGRRRPTAPTRAASRPTSRLKEEAVALAEPYVGRGDPGLVLSSSTWHKGVIGIGAARLVEQYQVPAVLIADRGRRGARLGAQRRRTWTCGPCSTAAPATSLRYGGHAQAAGMTLRARDIAAFREAFLAACGGSRAGRPVPVTFDLDLPLAAMSDAATWPSWCCELEQLEPFGSGNRKPVFRCRRPAPAARRRRRSAAALHLRFAFRGPPQSTAAAEPALAREFLAFGCGEAWRRSCGTDARTAAPAPTSLDVEWDILFQLGAQHVPAARRRLRPGAAAPGGHPAVGRAST